MPAQIATAAFASAASTLEVKPLEAVKSINSEKSIMNCPYMQAMAITAIEMNRFPSDLLLFFCQAKQSTKETNNSGIVWSAASSFISEYF